MLPASRLPDTLPSHDFELFKSGRDECYDIWWLRIHDFRHDLFFFYGLMGVLCFTCAPCTLHVHSAIVVLYVNMQKVIQMHTFLISRRHVTTAALWTSVCFAFMVLRDWR